MSDTHFTTSYQLSNGKRASWRAALAQLLSVMGRLLRVALIKCLSSMIQPPMRS